MQTLKVFALAAVMGFTVIGGAVAQSVSQRVSDIVIQGNQRVEDETVRSYLSIREGGSYTDAEISSLIKTLYATGLFNNVEVSREGGRLFITVQENALVNRVAFEGNEEVDTDRLREIIALGPRVVYTPDKVQRDVREILAFYRQRGRFLTKVDPQVIQRDQNRVDVIYEINEGEETKIRAIRFLGNDKFSDAQLKSVVRTREAAWWRFLTSADVYDPDRLELDKELLRRHYIKAGYADFRVVSAVAELSRSKESFHITYTLSEGKPYDFGQVAVDLAVEEEGLKAQELENALTIKQGRSYNGAMVEENIDELVDLLGAKGYAFLDIQPVFNQDEAAQTVDVTFQVVPGPRVYVNRIAIKGNTRTRDNVIRREMRLVEGDAFSTNKLKRSRDRLTFLDYFEDVNVRSQPTEDPDRMDLEVEVSEQSTGEFNIGAGFSSYEGVLATADIRERNFLGKGQNLMLGFTLSRKRQNFNFSFTEPWFLGQELSAGVDLFNERRDLQTESSFDLGRMGGNLRFGFPIDEVTDNTIRVGYKETEITNVDASASQFVKREEGRRDAISIANTYAVDTRDNPLTPTRGHRLAFTTEYSGFGTDVEYLRGILSGSWSKELSSDWVLTLGGKAGAIADLNDELPVFETFNAGGNNLRGFDYSGIGPRDTITSDALGGRYMLLNSAELTVPLGGQLKEMGVLGLFFVDGGIVTEFEDSPIVADSETYRVSVGTGVFWRSPMGPLRFEFGFPVVKAEEDETRIFNFSFGTRF